MVQASLGPASDVAILTGPEHYPRGAVNRPELYQSEYRLLATYSDWLRVYVIGIKHNLTRPRCET